MAVTSSNFAPVGQQVIRTDGTVVNKADGVNTDGSQNVKNSGSVVQTVSLLPSNTITSGTGTAQAVNGFTTLRIEVWGTGTFSVQIQVNNTSGSGTYYPVQVTNLSSLTMASSISSAGVYDIDVAGFSNVQANVISITGGNVNAVGMWVA